MPLRAAAGVGIKGSHATGLALLLAIRSSPPYREDLLALALLRALPDFKALAPAFASLRARLAIAFVFLNAFRHSLN